MRSAGLLHAAVWLMWAGYVQAGDYQLLSFSLPYHPVSITATDAEYTVEPGVMTIRTGHEKPWPGVTLTPQRPWDLAVFRYVCVDVKNLSSEMVKVYLRVDDPRADGTHHCLTGSTEIAPNQTETVMTAISDTPWVLDKPLELNGMRGYPGSSDVLDTSRVSRVLVFLANPEKDYTFQISHLRAEGKTTPLRADQFIPFIDAFGQFSHADWPGKIHAEADLLAARKREQAELSSKRGPDQWDQYGGWKDGPRLEATGFFRVEKLQGQWWLVDPEGRLFWSHGSDCVQLSTWTPITDREGYFAWLPETDAPFSEFYGQGSWAPHGYYQGKGTYRTFDFARSNLKRKYGDDFEGAFVSLCHRRLRSWGMNTIGNWSEAGVYLKRQTPYVATLHFGSREIQGSEGYWGKFQDVFDPAFRQSFRKQLETQTGQSINDPWCIGFFVQNELSWGSDTSLAEAALMSPPDQPAKIQFAAVLKKKYDTVDALNTAWQTRYSSWDDLLESKDKPDAEKAREDLKAFYSLIAKTYFSIIHDELQSLAPHQLYLGCRFAWVNDLAVRAASDYCDVISYNRYVHSVEDLTLPGDIDKPVIIGEFHFGALDRGMFHTGLVPCADQADRAEKYRAYVLGALRNPAIVGTHWFQFRDQATTGRGDGENYQIGLVDICDTPYPETLEAVRQAGYQLYAYRLAAGGNTNGKRQR